MVGVLTAAAVCRGQDVAERIMPSRRCGDQFIVDAMINGRGPFALVVDTGCSTLVLDARAAEKLGGATPVHGDAVTPTGASVGIKSAVKISTVRVGDVDLAGSSAPVLNLDRIRWAYRENIEGILGFDTFADLVFTLDFPAGQIRVRRGALTREDGAAPFKVRGRHQPVVQLAFGTYETEVVVDSGGNGGLELSDPERLEFRGEWKPVGAKMTVDGVRVFHGARVKGPVLLAGMTLQDPIVVKAGAESLVGCEVMRNYSWSFDQKNSMLLVRAKEPGPVSSPARRGTGMAVNPVAEGLEVIGVFEGGPAEEAGLKKGDLITRVNGVAVTGMECGGWQKVMQTEKRVTLTVKRGGEEVEKVIRVVEMVP